MKNVIKFVSMVIIIIILVFYVYGCGYGLRTLKFEAEFAPFREMPQEALKAMNPGDVKVMTGEPQIGKEYIELGYITFDEGKVSPIVTMYKNEKDFIELFQNEAAKHGADAVIKFTIQGEWPERKAQGITIVYK